jgi:hypothetical protein
MVSSGATMIWMSGKAIATSSSSIGLLLESCGPPPQRMAAAGVAALEDGRQHVLGDHVLDRSCQQQQISGIGQVNQAAAPVGCRSVAPARSRTVIRVSIAQGAVHLWATTASGCLCADMTGRFGPHD